MINFLIKYVLNKYTPKPNIGQINKIQYETEVLPFYIITRNNFIYCMKNKLLKRKDILTFKEILNDFVDNNNYKNKEFKNDCHEIYTKLASQNISHDQMVQLLNFINNFVNNDIKIVI